MLDFQPDLSPLRSNEDIPECMVGENLWHQVRFGKYLHGWGDMELPLDHIYDSDGAPLTKQNRKLRELTRSDDTEGFLVWWEYIKPRKIKMESKVRRKKVKTKGGRS
jgi:hypothetical protein